MPDRMSEYTSNNKCPIECEMECKINIPDGMSDYMSDKDIECQVECQLAGGRSKKVCRDKRVR